VIGIKNYYFFLNSSIGTKEVVGIVTVNPFTSILKLLLSLF